MDRLDPNFADFLRLLNLHDVKYLVVGGYAVGFHGFVRATGDLDVFVENSPANARALVAAFREFGFDTPQLREELFLEPGKIVRVGVPPLRLEVMNQVSGVSFAEAYAGRVEVEMEGLRICFMDRTALLRNKAASGRPKDLADIAGLSEKPPTSGSGTK